MFLAKSACIHTGKADAVPNAGAPPAGKTGGAVGEKPTGGVAAGGSDGGNVAAGVVTVGGVASGGVATGGVAMVGEA